LNYVLYLSPEQHFKGAGDSVTRGHPSGEQYLQTTWIVFSLLLTGNPNVRIGSKCR
jgi:hypothetical protein